MGSQTDRNTFDARILEQIETIRRIGNKRLHAHDALDDFVQEVLVRAYAGHDRLRDADRLPQWVAGIARNLAREWSRPSPISPVERIVAPSSDLSPLERVVGWERHRALLDA